MEQVKRSVASLLQRPEGIRLEGKRNQLSQNGDWKVFDTLMEKKTEEARSEVVTDKGKKSENSEKETVREEVKTEKPVTNGKDEEENCDVAREAACSQIVWLVNGNAQELVVTRQEDVVTINPPVIFGINDTPVELVGEEVIGQIMNGAQVTGEMQTEDLTATVEAELAPEQLVETVQETAQPQLETNVSEQEMENATIEVRVTEGDGEETGGESVVAEAPLFKDVEAAPIKVAEAPERAQESEPVDKQVAGKLTNLLESGETKVEIQLEPLELGKLTVELTRSADGTLNILLTAENAQTRGLLERHMGSLKETLIERGQQSVQVTVDRGEESQRQDDQQRNDFQDGSNSHQNEQRRRESQRGGDDFLQQLRLGLIPIEDEEET